MCVCVSLMLGPIYRLKSHWESIPSSAKKHYSELKTLLNGTKNYAAFRKTFQTGLGKPQIPHIAIVLKDLFQLEEIQTTDAGTALVYVHELVARGGEERGQRGERAKG